MRSSRTPTARRINRTMILCLALFASAPSSLAGAAGREPVLQQIRVPHSYCYREMYLPQATSGPSSVAWSPDGRALVYSMQGRLWRQRLGTDEAEQLTVGAGYDYQPDWSPDGRSIVYVSYRDDAMELWLLDLASLTKHPLTRNGAVNLEPRFSPEGGRLAFVSTAFGQRWHLFTMDLRKGEPGAPRRLTEDRESDLPRYYYSAFDHYLSPSWSPDGTEILFVSNHGRISGTGGFWRMAAVPGSEPREIRYEETTWKARPDWSPDGRRIIYSSYLGRQWHQLWIMTDEGGTTGRASRTILVERSGWYLLRAWSSRATHPVRDQLPFATTSPIYVTVGGEPVRSPEDAEYFRAWIDRLVQTARPHGGYNTAEEKAEVLKLLGEARAVFSERSAR